MNELVFHIYCDEPKKCDIENDDQIMVIDEISYLLMSFLTLFLTPSCRFLKKIFSLFFHMI